jgi:transposase-like protein
MAKRKTKERGFALKLRGQGKSYNQIRKTVGVSKSTLSYWLRGYPLSKRQLRLLQHNQRRIERYRETRLRKKQSRLKDVYEKQKKIIFPLSDRDFLIAGLFLYWGEGSKTRVADLEVANTDPAVPKFFVYWVTKFLQLDKAKIKARLHLYSDMDIEKETEFWSKTLGISKTQFTKPYIKKSSSKSINYRTFGHGTCTIRIGNARVAEEVMMGLKSIREHFGP